jgi:hypothetical protein
MTAKSKARARRSQKSDFSSDTEECVRQRAYELYEQRGRGNGFAWTTGSELKGRY